MISKIVARLEEKTTSFKAIRPAEDVDALSKGTAPQDGAVFVLPYREQALPSELMGVFRQIVAVQFLTAFFIRRHDDAKGGKKASAFDTYKAEIEAALAGWEPDFLDGPVQLVAGQAAPLGNGTTVYVSTWETRRYLEGADE